MSSITLQTCSLTTRFAFIVIILSVLNSCARGEGVSIPRQLKGPASSSTTTPGGIVLEVTNRSSAAQNIPLTFGQVFSPGAVDAGKTLLAKLDGESIDIQVDKKASHADGSLRHAIISALLPRLGARKTAKLEIFPGVNSASEGGVSLDDLLNSGFDAVVTLTLDGATYSASARTLLRSQAENLWLDGPICREWMVGAPVMDKTGKPHPHLTARFNLRAFRDVSNVLVDVTLENNWTYEPHPQHFTYAVEMKVGGDVVFSGDSLTHMRHTRWHKRFWRNGTPRIYLAHDARQIMATGALPNYDPSLIGNVTENSLRRYADYWVDEKKTYQRSSKHPSFTFNKIGPMGLGLATQYMPMTGAHDDIGPLPRWAAIYLLSQDTRAKTATVGMGDLAASWSIHYRDRSTDLPVSIDDYPAISSGYQNRTINPKTGEDEEVETCRLEKIQCSNPYTADNAHQPSLVYLPYLITGDYFLLEELQFWANWNLVDMNPAYRGYSEGLFHRQQVRGQGWSMRTLAHAAYITPDEHPLKAYFVEKLQRNIDNYIEANVADRKNDYGMLNLTYGKPDAAPWMDDFFTWAIGASVDMGFESARPLLEFKARFPVQRMGFGTGRPDDYCWIFAAPYELRVMKDDSSAYLRRIAEAYKASNDAGVINDHGQPCGSQALADALDLEKGEMTGYAHSPTGFPSNMQPALAIAVDAGIEGATEAWQRFETRAVKPDYSGHPNFAVVPRAKPIPVVGNKGSRGSHVGSDSGNGMSGNDTGLNPVSFGSGKLSLIRDSYAQGDTVSNKVLKVGPTQTYQVPSEAAAAAQDGDTVEIDAGVYRGDVAVWHADGLTIRGVGGRAHIDAAGTNAQGKGTWIVKGDNTVIENIEFSGSRVPDRNGSGIRQEGTHLIIRNCYFHDNENGILSGRDPDSEILIENSEFANNGYGDGRSHNIYIGEIGKFTLRFSSSHHAIIGHNVKSRAHENYILYNRIMDEQDGTASYAIDLPQGGRSFIIGNVLQQGANTDNPAIVAFAQEGARNPSQELYVINNTLVNDRRTGTFIVIDGNPTTLIQNNVFAGNGDLGFGRLGPNLQAGDPGFVDRRGYDYRLTHDSMAVDAGVEPDEIDGYSLVPHYQYMDVAKSEARVQTGSAIDDGAYEYTGDGGSSDGGSEVGDRNSRGVLAVQQGANPHAVIDLAALDRLKPGQWYEIEGSNLSAVYPDPLPPGSTAGAAVMSAWNGAAYDSENEQLVVWGGGHGNYAGNEVYAFSVKDLVWRRLSEPSTDLGAGGEAYYRDGKPTARHTYDSLEYVPALRAVCAFGSAALYPGVGGAHNTDCFNPATSTWFRVADVPRSGYGTKTGYDPGSGLVWHHAGGYGFLSAYDPVSDKWTRYGEKRIDGFAEYVAGVVDPARKKFVSFEEGEVVTWDLRANPSVMTPVTTTGDTAMLTSHHPALEYDPVIDKIVAWNGGADVYTLDLDTRVWSKRPLDPENNVIPTEATDGAHSRFRYIPSKNLYITVNATKGNVYFYRLALSTEDE